MQPENGNGVAAELPYLRDRLLFLLWRLLQSRVREAAAVKYTKQVAQAAAARAAKLIPPIPGETTEQKLARKLEQRRAYMREYMRTHKEGQRKHQQRMKQLYINPVDPELRRHDVRRGGIGAVNSPAQLEALAYRYFVCRFGSPLRRHRRIVTPYNGSGSVLVLWRQRTSVPATVTAVDPVTALNGRLTALDDMHYRAAITVARLEQTVQPS